MLSAKEQVAAAMKAAKNKRDYFNELMPKLKAAGSMKELQSVYDLYKEAQKEVGEGNYVFSYTKSKKFWDKYKDKKKQLGPPLSAYFTRFMNQLNKCKDYLAMRELVFSMNELKEEKNLEYLFEYDDSKKFWAKWAEKKAKYYPVYLEKQKEAVQELEELIMSSTSPAELKLLRFRMWECPYINNKEVGGPLQEMIDERIAINS